ncbi:MAG: sensor histidine kinase [Frankiaceae bacterium]
MSSAPRLRRWVRAIRAGRARTPRRLKLIAALLGLVALGLAVTGFAGTAVLRQSLLDRVDGQLDMTSHAALTRAESSSATGAGTAPAGPADLNQPAGAPPPGSLAPESSFFTEVTDASGKGTPDLVVPQGKTQTAPTLPVLDQATVQRLAGQPFTAAAQGTGHDWRVLVQPLADGSGAVTVAVSLDDVDATVSTLQTIDLEVGLSVLALLGVLGFVAVRSSLRRLVEVERTAEAIAAGDLSRRVPDADDRTEVGRLAAALNEMLTQIETAFAQRQASEAEARAAADRMRCFVADASHELRTPLTSIRGFAELHRMGAVADRAAGDRVMSRIESEAKRMGLLVEDLLLLARLDQQRPLDRTPVDLSPLAADAVHDARTVAPDHHIRFEAAAGPRPVVLGDEARLRQVVANLVGNACTHTPSGTSVTVRVTATCGCAVLEVADDGPGMRAEDAARVFERFYRADRSRTRASGGTGLGLSIVASLVAAHGGTVAVDTSPGKGACFTVGLPLHLDEVAGRPAASMSILGAPS